MRSTTSFGGEVKSSVPCGMILRRVEDPQSFRYVVSATTKELVMGESGMIRTQRGSAVDQKIVTVACDSLYDTNCNRIQTVKIISIGL
jgi:hypothetical protein